ncbi:MAG: HAD-IA family hydrolase [Panacagrimonas sp.]
MQRYDEAITPELGVSTLATSCRDLLDGRLVTLKALLLDVDGTLADTERHGHRPAYNRAFRKLGLDFRWGPKLYRKLLEQPGGKERILHYVHQYRPDLGIHAPAFARDPMDWVREVHLVKSRYFQRYLRSGKVPLRPGVARLIRDADAAGLSVALVSNASRASLAPVLKYGLGEDLAARIDVIVSGDDVERKKPSPDSYLLAMSKLGVCSGECIALEDSQMGLAAAVAAGVPTIVTTNANTEGEDFSSAWMVLDGCGEPHAPLKRSRGPVRGPCLTLEQLRGLADSRRSL